jgi:hypothetical protein
MTIPTQAAVWRIAQWPPSSWQTAAKQRIWLTQFFTDAGPQKSKQRACCGLERFKQGNPEIAKGKRNEGEVRFEFCVLRFVFSAANGTNDPFRNRF